MNLNNIKWDNKGLIPAVVQDASSSNVLMLGYMNNESIHKTIDTNEVTFFSRSKQRLWTKGETSGNKLLGTTCGDGQVGQTTWKNARGRRDGHGR